MKTNERILLSSLALFNSEGEQNVTTVDIANELDISPGNLYYHFKGKEAIITQLFARLEAEMHEILVRPSQSRLRIKDHWFYIYVVLEAIYEYRFFYLNLTDILQRIPELERRFKQLVTLQERAVKTISQPLRRHGLLNISDLQLERLSETVSINILYWPQYQRLRNPNVSLEMQIHKGVFQILSLFGPYLSSKQQGFYDATEALYEQLIAATPEFHGVNHA